MTTDPLRKVCEKAGVAYGIVWTKVNGTLSATEQYVAKSSTEEDSAEKMQFVLRSCQQRITLGEGLIGQAFHTGRSRLISNMQSLQAKELGAFFQQDPSQKKNIHAVAFVPERSVSGDVVGVWEMGFNEYSSQFDEFASTNSLVEDARFSGIHQEITQAFIEGVRPGIF